MKHTPGPWEISHTSTKKISSSSRLIIADGDKWVGFAYGTALGVENIEMAEANAKLIAAAPDMLEALSQAIELVRKTRYSSDETQRVYDSIQAAIDKAIK